MYVFYQCLPRCSLGRGVWCPREVELAIAIAQCNILRSVHWPRMSMRCAGVSPVASVSPQVKPMRTSLISGEGDLKVSSFKRSLVVDDLPSSARGRGVGLVLKRGSIVGGLAVEFVVSPRDICHEPSPAKLSMSLTVCGGSIRFE